MRYGMWLLLFISTATGAVDSYEAGRFCFEYIDKSLDGPCQATHVANAISEHMTPSQEYK